MNKLANFLGIVITISTSFYIGWTLGKKKYENIADIEVASVKLALEKHYSKFIPKVLNTEEVVKDVVNKDILKLSSDDASDNKKKYIDYSEPYRGDEADNRISGDLNVLREIKKEDTGISDKPYIITPEEFGESLFEAQTLFYYADKVLADDDYNVIDHVDELIGEHSLTQFGEYEENCVYVRNEKLGIDYEILLDERFFGNIKPSNKVIPGINSD